MQQLSKLPANIQALIFLCLGPRSSAIILENEKSREPCKQVEGSREIGIAEELVDQPPRGYPTGGSFSLDSEFDNGKLSVLASWLRLVGPAKFSKLLIPKEVTSEKTWEIHFLDALRLLLPRSNCLTIQFSNAAASKLTSQGNSESPLALLQLLANFNGKLSIIAFGPKGWGGSIPAYNQVERFFDRLCSLPYPVPNRQSGTLRSISINIHVSYFQRHPRYHKYALNDSLRPIHAETVQFRAVTTHFLEVPRNTKDENMSHRLRWDEAFVLGYKGPPAQQQIEFFLRSYLFPFLLPECCSAVHVQFCLPEALIAFKSLLAELPRDRSFRKIRIDFIHVVRKSTEMHLAAEAAFLELRESLRHSKMLLARPLGTEKLFGDIPYRRLDSGSRVYSEVWSSAQYNREVWTAIYIPEKYQVNMQCSPEVI